MITNIEESSLYLDQINWSKIGFGKFNVFNTKQILTTIECLKEEVEELNRATTPVLALDAVCDIFVVNAQLQEFYFPLNSEKEKADQELLSQDVKSKYDYIKYFNFWLHRLQENDDVAGYALLELWKKLAKYYESSGFDVITGIKRVTTSNYSKYPLISLYSGPDLFQQLDTECEEIEEKSDGRYNHIVWSISTVNDIERIVFRADGGNGKIMKPSHYFEPILSDLVPGVKHTER